MSRIHPEEYWEDGDIYSPDEPNREFAAIAGEMNGHIDADNIDALLVTGAKAALDLFHEIIWIEDAGPTNIDSAGNIYTWQVLETTTITTGDTRMKVEGQATFDADSANGARVELAVLIDGEVVARSGVCGRYVNSQSLNCVGAPFMAPGTHTVELSVRAYDNIAVNARSLWGRVLAR